VGFLASDDNVDERIMEVVTESMRPELLNRIDATVVFHALDRNAIEEIAAAEVARMTTKLADRGYLLTVPDDVVRQVASDGYDEKFGARHLQRSLERNLLEPMTTLPSGSYTAVVDGSAISWIPA
jgi:ATP-dependent Clp protease ATP-binding subunit ClpB